MVEKHILHFFFLFTHIYRSIEHITRFLNHLTFTSFDALVSIFFVANCCSQLYNNVHIVSECADTIKQIDMINIPYEILSPILSKIEMEDTEGVYVKF